MRRPRRPRDGVSARNGALADLAPSRRLAHRSLAFLFVAGGFISFLVVLLPHPEEAYAAGFWAVGCAAVGLGLIVLATERRLPPWALQAFVAAGTVLITLDICFSGEGRGAPAADNEMLYVWVALYTAYFFGGRGSLAQIAWVGVCYGVALALIAPSGIIPTRWLETVGTLGISWVLVSMLKHRVGELVERLADAARTDPLTGLHNRRGFEEAMAAEIERARRAGAPLTLLLADLDHFKRVNDRLGHVAGDVALTRVGRILTAGKRQIDYAARTGGEEFALILPDTTASEAYVVAERLRTAVDRAFGTELVPLTFSFGVASHPDHGHTSATLLSAADRALYAAKEMGRNRSVIYSSEVGSGLELRGQAGGEAHAGTLVALARALDLRDACTGDHSQTVGRHCEAIARELGLAPGRVERVRLAGILHDIGKVGVPDAILRKPEALDDEEWAEMRRHPEIGARVLGAHEFDDIRPWVLAHHERLDGNGYPHGLREADIPLEARILAVADAYEAMTSDRLYRRALGSEAAREELLRGAGSQFDPRVVRALLAVVDRAPDSIALA